MGTVISLTLPGHAVAGNDSMEVELAAAAAVVECLFMDLDKTFSLYRPDSEASRIACGGLSLRNASASMRERYAEAAYWRLRTDGAFTPERSDGVLDLSGLIKGHAIREAGTSLLALGRQDWCLNAGGDVLVSGSPQPENIGPGGDRRENSGPRAGAPWQAGIVDPRDRGTLVAGYPLGAGRRHSALATSGSAERGDHIWGQPRGAAVFIQVSVAAADIVTADVLATAIVAGGLPMLDLATKEWDVDVLAIRADGDLLATPGFRG
jgi:thiamine biosynthesis lipoprotein